MDERAALVAAIAANPDDDTPRLAFADWLQEHGEDDRAEFVRLQCELHQPVQSGCPPRSGAEYTRVNRLFLAHWREWFRPLILALGADEPQPPDGRPYQSPSVGTSGASIARPHPYRPTPLHDRTYFLDRLSIDRGFAVSMALRTHHRTRPCSVAEAFRWEPITGLDLSFETERPTGSELLDPALLQLRWLLVTPEGPEHPNAVAFLTEFLNPDCWSGLRSLAFSNVANEPTTPADWIAAAVRQPWVGKLTAFSASLTDAGLRNLLGSAASHRLESLGFYSSRFSVGAVSSLAELRCRHRVKELDLSSSELGEEHIVALASTTGWDALEQLDLGFNPVGDNAAVALARSSLVRSLRRLRMSQTELTEDGIQALADALNPQRIERLEFNYSEITEAFERSMRERFGDKIDLSMDD
jgi:uncharacterized protein (TIGR02996 family)